MTIKKLSFLEIEVVSIYSLWQKAIGNIWPITLQKFQEILLHQDSFDHSIFYVAFDSDTLVGFISAKWKQQQGQIQLVLVDPDFQRHGIGTSLLQKTYKSLTDSKIKKIQVGAGAYSYFWPGIPQNLESGVAFFKKQRAKFYEEMVDMVADLNSENVNNILQANRYPSKYKLSLAKHHEYSDILSFEKKNFPDWYDFYSYQLKNQTNTDQVLVASTEDNQVVGTVIIEDSSKWELSLFRKVGGLGALGVSKKHRGKGIGKSLAVEATKILQERGFSTSTAEYTYLVDWYSDIGYSVWRRYQMAWFEFM
jgi:beta-N-acetylhexosaminidase